MSSRVPSAAVAATSPCVSSDAGKTSTVKSDVEERGWFADAAQVLLPAKKPGTFLHYLTGYDERLCQKYAAGTVKPSAHFLRVLLRSDQGAQWLAAIMDGSAAPWWRDHQRTVRLAAAADRFQRELADQA